ncbi:MAG: TerB family tellurite resistance protein [Rhodospirillales bacterium]|nr:TerB family tellurite resistance protein [Alphaproteobacteria bacterium]USO03552.1 MAG: TerB family tellurite resistance protein [Rhodospirillales bacterium]
MGEGLSNSRFYMWRAVVAMAHADGVVTPQEIHFLQDSVKDIEMSEGQIQVLMADLGTPQDIYMMFSQITDPRDKKDFFKFARVLSWSDGDFDAQEKHIVETLEKIHMDESSRLLLRESKMEIQEIPLEADQWTKTIRNKGILSLLGEER